MSQGAERTFTLLSSAPASPFTPVAALVLALLANGTAISLQREPESGVLWVSVNLVILAVPLVTIGNSFHRLISMPSRLAHWSQLGSFTLVMLVLSSAFLGPLTLGIVRWATIVIGVPWMLMLWLTLRELARLIRSHRASADGNTTASDTAICTTPSTGA
ncbi:hypothetical protein GEV27_10560 [Aeromicrobium sp. S22]|uniref:hypothetical protein n=1 Tax=Aeromicrobium sp. S22 TaxID=2662029 RepID=UPI00129E9A0C|nr:hypothetical protein [Aeromicrobium sp. S22]MRK01964.1 hypothetical protein [Aeromicrobium sp. S22]